MARATSSSATISRSFRHRARPSSTRSNVWQFMRDNWLSNRIFDFSADSLDYCCYAWNTLVDQSRRIMSLGLRRWAHRS